MLFPDVGILKCWVEKYVLIMLSVKVTTGTATTTAKTETTAKVIW